MGRAWPERSRLSPTGHPKGLSSPRARGRAEPEGPESQEEGDGGKSAKGQSGGALGSTRVPELPARCPQLPRTPGGPPKLGVEPCVYTGRPRGRLLARELRLPRVGDAGGAGGDAGVRAGGEVARGLWPRPYGTHRCLRPSRVRDPRGTRGARSWGEAPSCGCGLGCRPPRPTTESATPEAGGPGPSTGPRADTGSLGGQSRAFPLRFSPRAGGWRGTGLPRWVWAFVRVHTVRAAQPGVSAGRRYLRGCSMRRCPGGQRAVQGSFTDGGSRGSTCPSEMGVGVRGAGVRHERAKPGLGSPSLSVTTWSNDPAPTFPALAAGVPPPRVAQSGDTTLPSALRQLRENRADTALRPQAAGLGGALPRRGWTVWLCL